MKIALIADVHANLPALEAVLKDVREQRVDQIWHLGDFLGYGPFPEEVVDRLVAEKVVSIAGNYDLNVLAFPRYREAWKKKKHPAKYFSFEWTFEHISRKTKAYLRQLPRSLSIALEGMKIQLVHGSPVAIDEPLLPTTPLERLAQLAKGAKQDVILCGHSHVFFTQKVNLVWFINPGSVGRPFDQDPRASYAVVEFVDGKVTVANRRIVYDAEKTIRQMREEKFPDELCQSIALGISLDQILAERKASTDKEILDKALALAESCHYDYNHAHQVTKLALMLFDQLEDLHLLEASKRIWLEVAGLLHDIGWVNGQERHHKTGRDIILADASLPLSSRERRVVAQVVRYHRRALPKKKHKDFAVLNDADQWLVNRLAALLRLADGLDYSHQAVIEDLRCHVTTNDVVVDVHSRKPCVLEQEAGQRKSDLFQKVFKRPVNIRNSAGPLSG